MKTKKLRGAYRKRNISNRFILFKKLNKTFKVAIKNNHTLDFDDWWFVPENIEGECFYVKNCLSTRQLYGYNGLSEYNFSDLYIITSGEFKGKILNKKHCKRIK